MIGYLGSYSRNITKPEKLTAISQKIHEYQTDLFFCVAQKPNKLGSIPLASI